MTNRDATSGEASPANPAIVATPRATSTTPPQAPRPGGDWWEVLIVLCVAFVPSIYANFEYLARESWLDPDRQQDQVWDYAAYLLYSPINCILVLYFVWRNGECWSSLGMVPFRWIRDPAAAIGCLVALFVSHWIGYVMLFAERNGVGPLFLQAGTANWYATPLTSPGGRIVWVASICVAAFAEELLYRGYLITRMGPLLQSSGMAVFVAAVLFAIAHFYQGFEGVLSTWMMGLVYGGLFLWLRRLWP